VWFMILGLTPQALRFRRLRRFKKALGSSWARSSMSYHILVRSQVKEARSSCALPLAGWSRLILDQRLHVVPSQLFAAG